MKCPHCNKEIEKESVYCECCGKKVRKSKRLWLVALGICFIGLIVLLLALEYNEKTEKEERFYLQCSSADDYREYLSRYPKGLFVLQATSELYNLALDSINEEIAKQQAEAELLAYGRCNTARACREYLKEYPNGAHFNTVMDKLQGFIADSITTVKREQQERGTLGNQGTSIQQTDPRSQFRGSVKYVVIDGSELRLRKGPSTSYDTFKWPDGTNRHPKVGEAFRYLKESNGFFNIDFHGHSLWVSAEFSHIEYR